MFLSKVQLVNFRNIELLNLELAKKINIFIGENGHGKTNLLESIYFGIKKDSFRYYDRDILIKKNSLYSLIQIKIENEIIIDTLKVKILNSKSEYFLNEKKLSFQNNLPHLILFSPESLSIIKESSDERRKLLDDVISSVSVSNKNIIQNFKKILKSRNKLLKDILEKKIDYIIGLSTLESLNHIFIEASVKLIKIRIETLKNLKPIINEKIKEFDQTQPTFDFKYIISDQNIVDNSEENLTNILSKRLNELKTFEINSGVSLIGPQKHDVIFLYNGNDSRYFCSQGQQRSIILAFKIAQIVYHHKAVNEYPILLLDDVMSELDELKQNALIKTLNSMTSQVFITTTHYDIIQKLGIANSKVFTVKNGEFKLTGV